MAITTIGISLALVPAAELAAAHATQRYVRSGTWTDESSLSGGSFVPGVGEAMDVALFFDGDAAWWEKGLAAVSLGQSILTLGTSGNLGAIRAVAEGLEGAEDAVGAFRAVSRAEADDIVAHGFRAHPDGMSMEDKWFSESREGAELLIGRMSSLDEVVEAQVPRAAYERS